MLNCERFWGVFSLPYSKQALFWTHQVALTTSAPITEPVVIPKLHLQFHGSPTGVTVQRSLVKVAFVAKIFLQWSSLAWEVGETDFVHGEQKH